MQCQDKHAGNNNKDACDNNKNVGGNTGTRKESRGPRMSFGCNTQWAFRKHGKSSYGVVVVFV